MAFKQASEFLIVVAKKYSLGDQALASIICRRVNKIFKRHFSQFSEYWQPKKFEDGKLFVFVDNSTASSELYLRTHEIMEIFDTENFPVKITEICIQRK